MKRIFDSSNMFQPLSVHAIHVIPARLISGEIVFLSGKPVDEQICPKATLENQKT